MRVSLITAEQSFEISRSISLNLTRYARVEHTARSQATWSYPNIQLPNPEGTFAPQEYSACRAVGNDK